MSTARFAIKNGDWSDPTLWDNGSLPTDNELVFANGSTVNIDQDITVGRLSVYYPSTIIPDNKVPMYTSASSAITSSTVNGANYPHYAFDGDDTTYFQGVRTSTEPCILAYTFDSPISIQQYAMQKFYVYGAPSHWTFEGSNDANTWDTLHTVTGNTSVPRYYSGLINNTSSFQYYRIVVTRTYNGTTYLPQIYSFEMTDSTTESYGTISGGVFNLTGSADITFTEKGFETNNSTCINISSADPDIVNINTSGSGKILSGDQQRATNGDPKLINITGNGTVNLNGDLVGRTLAYTGYSRQGQVYINGSGTVNIIGNVYGMESPSYDGPTVRLVAANAVLNITGNVYSSTVNNNRNNTIWATNSAGTINITGNIIARGGSGIYITSATTLNHTGTVQVIEASSRPGIVMLNPSGQVNLSTPLINYQSNSAIASYRMRFNSGSAVEWQVQDTADTNFNIYSSNVTGSTLGLPLTSNVKSGITFGPDNDLTGTLVIPSADNVRKGVAVDNTVGTAELTAEDFLTAISSSSNPVATRLKNVATVQTVGEHFNVFNP